MIRQNVKKKYNRYKHVMPNVMKTPSNHPDYPSICLATCWKPLETPRNGLRSQLLHKTQLKMFNLDRNILFIMDLIFHTNTHVCQTPAHTHFQS